MYAQLVLMIPVCFSDECLVSFSGFNDVLGEGTDGTSSSSTRRANDAPVEEEQAQEEENGGRVNAAAAAVNPCDELPCKNGALCTASGATYTCACNLLARRGVAFRGKNCEIEVRQSTEGTLLQLCVLCVQEICVVNWLSALERLQGIKVQGQALPFFPKTSTFQL